MTDEKELAQKYVDLMEYIGQRPNGAVLSDAQKTSGLSYRSIRKTLNGWGYKIEKRKVARIRMVNVIVKEVEE